MDWAALIDPQSGLLVLGGTALATVLRSGRAELAATAHMLVHSFRPRFNFDHARAELAHEVDVIRTDGFLRAPETRSSDAEFIDVSHQLVKHRSVTAMLTVHRKHQKRRKQLRKQAEWTLSQAGELAPVFGMAGTLFALSQIHSGDIATDTMLSAIATAIVTTLYGLLAAHMLFFPIARWVTRRAEFEEEERQRLIEWLTDQLSPVSQDKPVFANIREDTNQAA